MVISYNVYANDGRGGLVDYSKPVATTADHGRPVGPLSAPSDNTFAVRAFDTASGIEEANSEARIRVVIDEAGNDVTARPNAVKGLSARATVGGTCRVSWGYDRTGQGGPPARFDVTLKPDSGSAPPGPSATVAYLPGVAGYGCSLSNLAGGVSYAIAVRAVGASALLVSAPATVTLEYPASSLARVEALAATPSA